MSGVSEELFTEDIKWYIESIKKDKRKLTPELRLELAAELSDVMMELKDRNEIQRVREESHKNS